MLKHLLFSYEIIIYAGVTTDIGLNIDRKMKSTAIVSINVALQQVLEREGDYVFLDYV